MELDKLYSKAAEAAVLGSMIIDPTCIPDVIAILPDDDLFYLPENRTIYSLLTQTWFEKGVVDGVLVREALTQSGQLESIGGLEYLQVIIDSVPSSANAVYYAGVVREKAQERQLVIASEQISTVIGDSGDVSEKIQQVRDLVLSLDDDSNGELVTGKDATKAATDLRDDEQSFLTTGFQNIDRIITGLCPGQFVIIAGRPSMGKSCLALDVALNVASGGVGVLYISLEMPGKELLQRAICSGAKISLARAKSKLLTNDEWNAVYESSLKIADKTNLIIDTSSNTPQKQIALIRRLRKTHNVGLVIVDYLQLLSSGRKTESRQQEITTICRKLKLGAMSEGIPIVCLSQLNREVEARTGHRPRLSDLRESGSIEQDADIVMLVHREDYYRQSENPQAAKDGLAEVHIAKQRNGPCGTARLTFFADYIQFGNLLEY